MSLKTIKVNHFCTVVLACCFTISSPRKTPALTLSGPLNDSIELKHSGTIKDQYDYTGEVHLSTLKLIPVGGAKRYEKELRRDFPSPWKFVDAEQRNGEYALQGSFQSKIYEKCGPKIGMDCKITSLEPLGGPPRGIRALPIPTAVGSLFVMQYNPLTGEPSGNDANFVQMVNASYADTLSNGCSYQPNTWIVDRLCNATTPYYLEALQLSGGTFYADRPFFSEASTDISFLANAFLVKQGSDQIVTLYDGVDWGWKNTVSRTQITKKTPLVNLLSSTPPSAPLAPPDFECYDNDPFWGYMYWCNLNGYSYGQAAIADIVQENPYFTTDPSQQVSLSTSQNIESVPTPALLPTLVATGIYHGRKWRKRQQQNKNPDNAAA